MTSNYLSYWTHNLALSGSTIYAAGFFEGIGGQSRNNIAAVNASNGAATSWNPNANGYVSNLVLSGTTLYGIGDFTQIGGQTRNRIAALNTATGSATTWNPNPNSIPYDIEVVGSAVYVGGYFTTIGGQNRNRLARLNNTTGAATAWNPNANAEVYSVAASTSLVIAGGGFSAIGGQSRLYLAAFDLLAPAAPTSASAGAILQNGITWTWNDNANNETGFKVYADLGAGPPATLRATTAQNATSWTFPSLTPNTQYCFQVAATNGVGDSAKTANTFRWTLAGTPLAPLLSSPTGSTISLSINPSDGNPAPTVYAVQETTSGLYVQANGTLGAGAVFQTRAGWGTTTVTGLNEATLYGFRATARNGGLILTSPGAAASLSTLDVTPPAVLSITPALPGPTIADSVEFEVIFSEPVQNFEDTADLVLVHTGTADAGATFAGGGGAYTVTVEGLSGDGSFTLSVALDSGVQDLAGNALTASVTSGPVLLDNTPPEALLTSAAAPFVNGDIAVDIALSEPTTNLETGDWQLDNAAPADFQGSGDSYTLTLSPLGQGHFSISLPAGVFTDAAGNGNLASTALERNFDTVEPAYSGIAAAPAEATAGTQVLISFEGSETLDGAPSVSVNGNAALPGAKSGEAYAYTYTVQPSDPFGPAVIEIYGFDLAGNLGTAQDNLVLSIVPAAPELPLGGAGALAALLILIGTATLRRR